MSNKGSIEIARIKGKKDAYDILGLNKNSSDLDDAKVKKAYKKLALLLHPGKDYENQRVHTYISSIQRTRMHTM